MNDPTSKIIDCIIRVHQKLGPGFLEKIYRNALFIELKTSGLNVTREEKIKVFYDKYEVGEHFLDLWVERCVILELKTVDRLNATHYAQLRSYMRATRSPIGMLVNFAKVWADWRRIDMVHTDIGLEELG